MQKLIGKKAIAIALAVTLFASALSGLSGSSVEAAKKASLKSKSMTVYVGKKK